MSRELPGRDTSKNKTRARDRMWEIFMASVVGVGSSSPVVLGLSENPDVRYTIRDEPWGVECKALYTTNMRTVRKELLLKCDQIMGADISRGFVAVDASDVINHGRDQHFRHSMNAAMDQIHARLGAIKAVVMADRDFDRRLTRMSAKVAGIVFSAQSAFPAREMMSILAPLTFVATSPSYLEEPGGRWVGRLTLGFRTVLNEEEGHHPDD